MNKILNEDRENGLFSHGNGNFISNITSVFFFLYFIITSVVSVIHFSCFI